MQLVRTVLDRDKFEELHMLLVRCSRMGRPMYRLVSVLDHLVALDGIGTHAQGAEKMTAFDVDRATSL